ncbi:MAG: outer membrane protein assembly factor BamC [Halopseudomonas yangmingensis]|uniref:Outer membrane protein assembly factor BamC n=1 Tax=Halopseudomonas yangmingensis TaxID=1720063 RepID=A0A1I4NH77_9GAMM|nr:outer membrane protein assembly factor BamC [Halopseudomonas yangmingensis]SFM14884.1 outer membrane protein assembly factor BamC [Halopseudomonas yangmingensis]
MKPLVRILALTAAGSLGGCGYLMGEDGFFRDRGSDYQLAEVQPRMSIPAGLEARPTGDLLPVPGEIRQGDGSKFVMPRPQPLLVSADSSEFSLQEDGASVWLLAQRTPVDSWPLVRRFASEYQLPVVREDVRLGELQTDWINFSASSDNPLARRIQPLLGERRRNNELQRFHIRIEPGVQRGTSEIFVRQMQSSTAVEQPWPERSANPALERAMLAELESYLNQSGDVDAASLVARQQGAASSRATLQQDGAGNPVLRIDSDFNRAWAAVGDALQRSDILVTDLNRSSGVYYVDLDASADKAKQPGRIARLFRRSASKDDASDSRLQVRLTAVGNRVDVSVERSIDQAADPQQARTLLQRIETALN